MFAVSSTVYEKLLRYVSFSYEQFWVIGRMHMSSTWYI